MPVLPASTYRAPTGFGNPHLQTILPVLLRRVPGVAYRRERITTPDDDFLDLDWLSRDRPRLAILSHGLEGDTGRGYIRGMAACLDRHGWDVLAWNCRGCSGIPNRKLRFYHSGATDDLDTVVGHVLRHHPYRHLALVGFSLGGNLTLKYLGERGAQLHPALRAAVAFSVPCDLAASSARMAAPDNRLYMERFLHLLHEKIQAKMILYPGQITDEDYHQMRSFRDFDNRYTAPLHGFRDAEDYWRQSSCRQFLAAIPIPTLLINALDDPFLAAACYPYAEAEANPNLHFETPPQGGHVGFIQFGHHGEYWSESRAAQFLALIPQ